MCIRDRAKVVAKFMQMGEMHAASDVIDFDSAALIAEEFHAKVEHEVHVSIEERLFTQEEDSACLLYTSLFLRFLLQMADLFSVSAPT